MSQFDNDPTVTSRSEQSVTYELFVFACTFIALILMVAYYLAPLSPQALQVLYIVNSLAITPILLFDFCRTLIRSQRRLRYFVQVGWLDLLGSFPGFPLLRLFRLARLVNAWRRMRRATPADILSETRQRLAQSTLFVSTFLALIVLTLGAIVIVSVESADPSANIITGEDAVWWSMVTVATVGYGDFYPVTAAGRFIAMLLMVVGVSIFSVLTSYLSTTFLNARKEGQRLDIAGEIAALRAEIAQLHEALKASQSAPNKTE